MATASKKTDPADLPMVVEQPTQDEGAEETNIIARLRQQIGTQRADKVRVKLYRIDPKSTKLTWCDDYSLDDFEQGDLPMVREDFGAGEYEIRLIGDTGVMNKVRVRIAEAPMRRRPPVAESPLAVAPGGGELVDVMKQLIERLADRPDPMASFMQNLALLKSMREVFAPPAVVTQPTGSSNLAQLQEALTLVGLLKDTARNLAGDDDKSPKDELLGMIGPLIGPVLEQLKAGGAQPRIAAPIEPLATAGPLPPIQLPGTIPSPAAEPAQPIPTPESTTTSVEDLVMQGAIEKIVTMATDGTTPEAGGEYIADNIPESMLALLTLPNWWAIVTSWAPALMPHEEWIKKAKAHADELLRADDDENAAHRSGNHD